MMMLEIDMKILDQDVLLIKRKDQKKQRKKAVVLNHYMVINLNVLSILSLKIQNVNHLK
jgi:hypothetical protein